jgi:hypothetical protein
MPALACLLLALPASPAPAPAPEDPATLPTPFTKDQIRAANPTGTELVHRVVDQREGGVSGLQTMRFTDSTSRGARVAISMASVAGKPLGVPAQASPRIPWGTLRDHAAFPADRATRVRTVITLAGEALPCWLYSVIGEGRTTTLYWFADELPGPPVKMEINGAEGQLYELVLASVRRPGEPGAASAAGVTRAEGKASEASAGGRAGAEPATKSWSRPLGVKTASRWGPNIWQYAD